MKEVRSVILTKTPQEIDDMLARTNTEPVGVWQNWYTSLVDDCKAIITEAVFTSRWALVEGYHMLGQRIVTDENYRWNARGNGDTLTGLSKSTGIGERDLYRAIQFYEKYPRLDMVPDGKNASWNKIITQYLPAPDGKHTDEPEVIDVRAIKRMFHKWWPTEETPDYDNAYEAAVIFSGLIAKRAKAKE